MKWTNVAVKPYFSWPKVQVELPFEGKKIVLQPGTDILSCAVSTFNTTDMSFNEGGTLISRFLSRLAWSMDGGVVELFITGSSNPAHPGFLGRGNFETSWWAPIEPWDKIYLPSGKHANADLALALFREGLSVNSAPFAFLSFFKVINITLSEGLPQKDWINANLSKLWYRPAVDRIRELNKSESDIGEYLYRQGRCAVAHANMKPLVNPDSYNDRRRLQLDLPLMKEISALFMEQEFGLLRDSVFWKNLRDGDGKSPELLKKMVSQDGKIVYEVAG